MSAALKKIAAQSKTLIIVHRIFDNWRRRRAFKAGNTVSAYGSTHEFWSLEKSVSYIDMVYREYIEYSGLGPEAFRGSRILEVGPGDNFGVALKFLAAAGADKVVCLDKFYSERNVEQQTRIYQELRKQLGADEARVFDECINLNNGIDLNPERLQYIYGHGIEEADQILEPGSFNFILSRAVIHNVYDIERGFEAMDRLLAPGGYMLHKIDLSDENMFSSRGMHPLTFLTIPERIYYLMASDSGKPNRKLIGDYREQVVNRGYDTKILITAVLAEGPLVPHKERIESGV
ncbi:MAG TPA: methyltransferase domain-containing protein, partial [Pyrinomonadaceae bacterium]|nr:methyltransferase domain-containing protein [Pyrinomonadaceae bacterium]